MPQQTPTHLFSYFGFVVWGDFGPITMYRSTRGKIVWFAKTWPDKPASPLQQQQRDRLTAAAAQWTALADAQRAQWELATHRGSLCMTGYNLFMHWKLTQDASAIRTLERQTRTTLLPP